MADRVLVVGPRAGLLSALRAAGVPFVVWSDRARRAARADAVHVGPFDVSQDKMKREAEGLAPLGPFTHVIAGTEASVMPAAVARRALGARTFAQTTVLRCHDKLAMKRHLAERGIPMTDFVDGNDDVVPGELVKQLGLPVVVKPRRSSGGRDIERIAGVDALARIDRRGRLLERYVDAPEVSVESFIAGGEVRFANVTEYARKTHVNVVPAGLDAETHAAVLEINRRVIRALNIQWGMTHLETYLTPGGILFGEIALRPPGGYIMELLDLAYGFNAWRAFVAMELDRPFQFPAGVRAHTAAVVLHPGPGTVASVRGRDSVAAHPAVVKASVRVRPGDLVPERKGIGSDVGHVILSAPTRDDLLDALAWVERTLQIDLAPPPGKAP